METLDQIIESKKRIVGIPLDDNEYKECFRQWLQQKQKTLEPWDTAEALMNEFMNELLEGLE